MSVRGLDEELKRRLGTFPEELASVARAWCEAFDRLNRLLGEVGSATAHGSATKHFDASRTRREQALADMLDLAAAEPDRVLFDLRWDLADLTGRCETIETLMLQRPAGALPAVPCEA